MNNNNTTLLTFKDARAASNYLARDDFIFEEEEPVLLERTEATARLRSRLTARLLIDPSEGWATCHPHAVGPARIVTVVYAGAAATEQRVWVFDQAHDEARLFVGFDATVGDRIVRELGRIKDGWAGEGTVAPSQQMLADVEAVADRLRANAKMPAIEIDEEDGSVALRWVAKSGNQSFSLVFRGNGKVLGVLATIDPPRSESWSLAVTDEVQIASRLDDQVARHLVAC